MTATMELPSARPYAYRFRPESTALIIIDMQRDFLDFNGFGMIQCGNDEVFAKVREIVPRTQAALQCARALGLHVVHTREGHRPDLSDLPPSKRLRQISAPSGHHTMGIGDQGPMGRLLVRGEYGHDIIDELRPLPGEVVIDKPGKGSMWDTTLHRALLARGITHLLFAGVTTECCVNTTAREAADRGFECCILADCTDGFDSAFYKYTLDMLCSYDGLFGFVGNSKELLDIQAAKLHTPPDTPTGLTQDLDLDVLRRQYQKGEVRPSDIARDVTLRIEEYKKKDPAVWTYIRPAEELLTAAKDLEEKWEGRPRPELYGIPFAVKDNIDVAGIATTVACEAFAYTPTVNAKVVTSLLNAGALFVGKTNLDQLATGLSGCRSPFGSPQSVFGTGRISGGSSSGSAVAVGANLVSFALGTDTAGSGRVPAAFNGVVGHKPTRGTLSAQGLVPACKSLDTISILAKSVTQARHVWLICEAAGPDPHDAYAKSQQSLALWHADFRGMQQGGFTFGIPPESALSVCDPVYRTQFASAVARMQRAGGVPVEIDWTPFAGGSELLYNASLVQERVACLGPEFLAKNLHTFHPATRKLYSAALEAQVPAWQVFQDLHKQAEYTRAARQIFEEKKLDALLVPSTTCHPTQAAMEQDPIALNAKLGEFTHFGNVLDMCAVALPASTYRVSGPSGEEELPFGVTVLGLAGHDGRLYDIAREFERASC